MQTMGHNEAVWAANRCAKPGRRRTHRLTGICLVANLVWLSATTMPAASRIESIPPDWQPVGVERLRTGGARASSSLGDAYAPERVCDGDRRMPGINGRAFFLVPDTYQPKFDFPLSPASARLTHVDGPVWMQEIEFTGPEFHWSIPFTAPPPPQRKEPTATDAARTVD